MQVQGELTQVLQEHEAATARQVAAAAPPQPRSSGLPATAEAAAVAPGTEGYQPFRYGPPPDDSGSLTRMSSGPQSSVQTDPALSLLGPSTAAGGAAVQSDNPFATPVIAPPATVAPDLIDFDLGAAPAPAPAAAPAGDLLGDPFTASAPPPPRQSGADGLAQGVADVNLI